MKFNKHLELEGRHAFMSPSGHSWLRYDKDKIISVFINSKAKEKGTEDHDFARRCIERKQRIYKSDVNLANYVNDAIGFRMDPEVVLKYTDRCFGTADAICFRKNLLRIHDLKTGMTAASMEQLEIYAAIFCLEYRVDPLSILYELRIYQYGEIENYNPEPQRIKDVADTIVYLDKVLSEYEEEQKDV